MTGKEKTDFRSLPPVKVPGQYPRTLCGDTKNTTLPARPGNSTREEILNALSGRLCEEASCYRGLENLCAQADTMRPIGGGSWGDWRGHGPGLSRTWACMNTTLRPLRTASMNSWPAPPSRPPRATTLGTWMLWAESMSPARGVLRCRTPLMGRCPPSSFLGALMMTRPFLRASTLTQ